MFDTTFSTCSIETGKKTKEEIPFTYDSRVPLMWEEHCLECAPPYCYNNCPLFLAREDSKCIRMLGGIIKTDELQGSLNYGIDCTFRKWAKLESIYKPYSVKDRTYRFYDQLNRALSKCFIGTAKLLKLIWPKLTPYGAYVAYRRKLFRGKHCNPELFYVKCQLKEKEQVQLLVQIDTDRILLSQTFLLKKGLNELTIPLNNCLNNIQSARIMIAPLNEETDTRIVFGWVDLFCNVRFSQVEDKPASNVKVLVWDLDNTLWNGTLVNGDVCIREEAVKLIMDLDKRGILNTISSKNDHELAMAKIAEYGLSEYFLSPAINWGQKSVNIQKIAKTLNLGLSSFAFIDDNIREREEVKDALPMVRVYSDKEIGNLISYKEFDVPISNETQNRRLSYMQELTRMQFKEEFSDNYDNFLKSLGMRISINFVDSNSKDRCFELLSRSNQLNLSTNRYSLDEYNDLLNNKEILCFSIDCCDKFGDYGIISFISLKLNVDSADLVDFVISCRVAKKKVENAIIRSLSEILAERGIRRLNARLVKTKRNGPLASVFEDLPFEKISSDDKVINYSLYQLNKVDSQDIIKVRFTKTN